MGLTVEQIASALELSSEVENKIYELMVDG